MPHIVNIHAVYPPEPVVSAQMGRDLAVCLAQSGAQVTVICPTPSRPLGADYGAFRPAGRPLVRIEEGVEVVRVPSFTAPRSRLLARSVEGWSFGRHVCQYLEHHLSNVNVVYANPWPLLSQTLIARLCGRRGIPLVWHISDLYPESLLPKLPCWTRKIVNAPLTALDSWIARQAYQTVVLSESVRQVYVNHRGLPPEKVVTILNWIDESRFEQLPDRTEACARYGVPEDRFTFLYLGNIGPVAGVEQVIDSFHAARLTGAQLVIAGHGSTRAKCVEYASRLDARGVRFISDPDAGNVPLLQSLAHVCLLPMRKGTAASSFPSKLMAYLLSGKPVLATLDAGSDTARDIQEAECGWVGEPENVAWLAAKMREVTALPPGDLEMKGQRGRAYGLKHFSRSQGVRRLAKLVTAAGGLELIPAPNLGHLSAS
jgi:glycosyltransferase involved in cell wall biosynthesis